MNKLVSDLRQLARVLGFYLRFLPSFTQIGFRARGLFWAPLRTDFRGQHWLISGGSGGLGRAMVFAALQGGATVTAAARSADKLQTLARDVAAAGLTGLDTERCDFTLVADTDSLVERLAAKGKPIDVLVNNVGVLNDDLLITTEGCEASFVSNLLSHYQLTEALIARRCLHTGALVINITSGGGYHFPLLMPMLNVTDPRRYSGIAAYGFHKRAQMVLNRHWNELHRARGITFYVMHPGWADTAGVQRSLPRFRRLLKPILRDEVSGCDTAVWLAAVRPDQPAEDIVWFDRKVRSAHVYPHTRGTAASGDNLTAFLQAQLTAARDQRSRP